MNRKCANRRTGIPVVLASLNDVYQTGKRLYRSLNRSRTMLLYGSSSRYGSRRFVSMCACARKNGENIPTPYQRTSISGVGFPKKPPTSAIRDNLSEFLPCLTRKHTSCKTHACYAVWQYHGNTNCHMLPSTHVVACPDSSMTLWSSKEWTRENERSGWCVLSGDESFSCLVMLKFNQTVSK